MLLKDLSTMIFKRSGEISIPDLSKNMKLWNIAWAMDGLRDLAAIAREDGYDLRDLSDQVSKLIDMGALVSVEPELEPVSSDSIQDLTRQLSQAIGPVAEIIVAKEIEGLGFNATYLSGQNFNLLVDRLTQKIEDPEKRRIFVEGLSNYQRKKQKKPLP